jgi:hypothetical protein
MRGQGCRYRRATHPFCFPPFDIQAAYTNISLMAEPARTPPPRLQVRSSRERAGSVLRIIGFLVSTFAIVAGGGGGILLVGMIIVAPLLSAFGARHVERLDPITRVWLAMVYVALAVLLVGALMKSARTSAIVQLVGGSTFIVLMCFFILGSNLGPFTWCSSVFFWFFGGLIIVQNVRQLRGDTLNRR